VRTPIVKGAHDDGRADHPRAAPQGKPRGGQEIFGVNSHIKHVTDGFVADGYLALAPAIFDRAERDFSTGYRLEDIDRGRGSLAWLSGTRIDGLACAVGYDGGAIAEHAQEKPRCPVLLRWGETDQSIPPDHWAKMSAAHSDVPMDVYPAGHGFNGDERGSYHEASAKLARTRTLEFLKQHLG